MALSAGFCFVGFKVNNDSVTTELNRSTLLLSTLLVFKNNH